ncbi:hypothetical protein EV1_029411 [Malus domestica]
MLGITVVVAYADRLDQLVKIFFFGLCSSSPANISARDGSTATTANHAAASPRSSSLSPSRMLGFMFVDSVLLRLGVEERIQ